MNILSRMDIQFEVDAARKVFPGSKGRLYAFLEEAGEVVKAFNDLKEGKTTPKHVRTEIIQAAASAIRLLEEGDSDFPEYDPDE